MLLITIVIGFILVFMSGVHFCAYKVDKLEGRARATNSLMWSLLSGIIGLYHIIALIGMAAK